MPEVQCSRAGRRTPDGAPTADHILGRRGYLVGLKGRCAERNGFLDPEVGIWSNCRSGDDGNETIIVAAEDDYFEQRCHHFRENLTRPRSSTCVRPWPTCVGGSLFYGATGDVSANGLRERFGISPVFVARFLTASCDRPITSAISGIVVPAASISVSRAMSRTVHGLR